MKYHHLLFERFIKFSNLSNNIRFKKSVEMLAAKFYLRVMALSFIGSKERCG